VDEEEIVQPRMHGLCMTSLLRPIGNMFAIMRRAVQKVNTNKSQVLNRRVGQTKSTGLVQRNRSVLVVSMTLDNTPFTLAMATRSRIS
jgi:hypothetical protein